MTSRESLWFLPRVELAPIETVEHLRRGWRHLAWSGDEIRGRPLPTGGQFAPGKLMLDPDIFDAHERMHPWIRLTVLKLLDCTWHDRWGDWREWARVYLAGSLASYWWGTLDFDVLIGVNVEEFKRRYPFSGTEEEVSRGMTLDFYNGIDTDVENFVFPPGDNLRRIAAKYGLDAEEVYETVLPGTLPLGPTEMTFFVNHDSYDIRKIHPYAAYDLTRDLWAVHPMRATKKWGPQKFSNTFWSHMADVADRIQDALNEADPIRRRERSQAEYDRIHTERNEAFGPGGGGQMDPRGLQWTVMVRWGLIGALEKEIHPDRPLGHPAPTRA